MSRLTRICEEVVDELKLNLNGLKILTEAGNGGFECTAIMAGIAGAENIYACTKSSRYGSRESIEKNIKMMDTFKRFSDRIKFVESIKEVDPTDIDVVTNLGHVRPITGSFIKKMKETSVISLMWEPWEFRKDLDLEVAVNCNMPVIGTNECMPFLQT